MVSLSVIHKNSFVDSNFLQMVLWVSLWVRLKKENLLKCVQ